MKFASFQLIHLIWIAIIFAIFLLWRKRVKQKILEKFIDKKLIREISYNFIDRNELYKIILLFLSLVFFVIALMRPQYGFEWQEVKREGLDIMVAIDVSKSMLTDDVKPDRLERSKLAVKDLIKELKGDRIGLIVFSGDAFMVCPLTVDYHGFALTLDDLSPKTISIGGTAIASAIDVAVNSYKDIANKYKALIIISDGEDHEGNIEKAAKEAAKAGIKVFCIGIGTTEGELIRYKDRYGNYQFVKDNKGNFIKSRLDEESLRKIAKITGGMYIRSSGAQFGLDLIYKDKLSKMEKRSLDSKMQKRFYERFQIPLAIAIFLFCLEMLIPLRRKQ